MVPPSEAIIIIILSMKMSTSSHLLSFFVEEDFLFLKSEIRLVSFR